VVRDIVVIGASAGGLAPLLKIVAGLPGDYAGSIFVVLHTAPDRKSLLPGLLSRAGRLPAADVADFEPVLPGRIYVAGPNRHLVLEPHVVRSVMGPKESLHRPSVDVLFRSAAIAYGERVVGVVLSGLLDDGASGLAAVRIAGGLPVVQDPEEADQASMPESVLRRIPVEHVLRAEAIAPLLADLAHDDVPREAAERTPNGSAPSTTFSVSCPSCNGPLQRTRQGGVDRYHCRIGHAFGEASLAAEHEENLERALWTALRILDERRVLHRRLAETARERGLEALAKVHDERARRTEQDVAVLEEVASVDLDRGSGAEPADDVPA
jgi:two-component system, chemotaxis family, protein-glutamate methylesterase/glutaminase